MHRQRTGRSVAGNRADSLWDPGSVVELPLLVTGQTAEHLESLANRKGQTLASFIRGLLDESLAREFPDGLPVPLGLVPMEGPTGVTCRPGPVWDDANPAE